AHASTKVVFKIWQDAAWCSRVVPANCRVYVNWHSAFWTDKCAWDAHFAWHAPSLPTAKAPWPPSQDLLNRPQAPLLPRQSDFWVFPCSRNWRLRYPSATSRVAPCSLVVWGNGSSRICKITNV